GHPDYGHTVHSLIMPAAFLLPLEGRLNPDIRWVVMASIIPWTDVEREYVKRLGDTSQGSRAYPVRLALGSLIIKENMGLSDEETVLAITENPYLQYFIGLHEFHEEAPFDASSMTHFRKRFDATWSTNSMSKWLKHNGRNNPKNARNMIHRITMMIHLPPMAAGRTSRKAGRKTPRSTRESSC